jgi:hypothetical protein
MLEEQLADSGLVMVELDRGGYGLLRATSLEGAPAVTASKYLLKDLNELKRRPKYLEEIRAEVSDDSDVEEEDS